MRHHAGQPAMQAVAEGVHVEQRQCEKVKRLFDVICQQVSWSSRALAAKLLRIRDRALRYVPVVPDVYG